MPTKAQLYRDMAESAAMRLTNSRENWTGFLDTAARLYKYPFAEQLMIYIQRPEATACAPLETWNNPMNRWVKRGSKGIALLDYSGSKPRLRYVFDVSDTEEHRSIENQQQPRRPYIWNITLENQTVVMDELSQTYGDYEGGLAEILHSVAGELAVELYQDNFQDILSCVDGSFLEDLDEISLETAFVEAVTVSATHAMMTRCGLDPNEYFSYEDYQPIFDFNTTASVYALGAVVSDLSEQVLRQIETTIKIFERKKERDTVYDRTNVQPDGRLHGTGRENQSAVGDFARQIRSPAEEISEKPPENIIQFPDVTGETAPAPARHGQDSGTDVRPLNDGTDSTEPAAGEVYESDTLGSTHEQPESAGGGDSLERTDIQLAPSVTSDGVSLSELLSDSIYPLEAVDAILRDGGNQQNCTLRIAAHYMKGKSPTENVEFLRREYRSGGKGFLLGTQRISIWFDENGIKLGDGPTVLHDPRSVQLTWEQVAERIHELLVSGQYIPQDELDKALYNERKELATKLLHLNGDRADSVASILEPEVSKGGYPEATERLAGLLAEPEQLSNIIDSLSTFADAYDQDRAIMRFHLHKPRELLQRLKDLQPESVTFTVGVFDSLNFMPFITQDEVETFLTRGSSIEHSKYRILSFFLHEHDIKEKADFIKKEYGWGGSSHALSGADNSYADATPTKGITLKRGSIMEPYDVVTLNWTKAARMIDELINTGRYMSREGLDNIPAYERGELAREVNGFFYNLPLDVQRPYDINATFDSDRIKEISNMLLYPESVDKIVGMMKPVIESTSVDDRHYEYKSRYYQNMLAYQNGTFSLFPNISSVPTEPVNTIRQPIATPEKLGVNPDQLSIFPTETEQKQIITHPQTPLLKDYYKVKAENPGCIVLYQVGDFYEAYQEDADSLAQTLNLSIVTQKEGLAEPLRKIGIPSNRLDEYIKKVVDETGVPVVVSHSNQITVNTKEKFPSTSDVDDILRRWNGDIDSKIRVYEHMYANARARETAAFLRQEYGKDSFVIADSETMPWAKVQRRIAQLIDAGQFLLPEEQAIADERQDSSWDNMVSDDKPDIGAHQRQYTPRPTRQSKVKDTEPSPSVDSQLSSDEAVRGRLYAVGDTVYLEDDKAFVISEIGKYNVVLSDPALYYPILRSESHDNFMRLLRSNPKNKHFTNNIVADLENTQDTSAYKLDYKYVNECLIVFNIANYDPDKLTPIVARVQPDGSIVIIDENLPESLRLEIRRVADMELDKYKAEAEANLQQMIDFAVAAQPLPDDDVEQLSLADIKPTVNNLPSPAPVRLHNFHITDEHLGEGGAKTKYGYNIAAIRTLKQLEAEQRTATPDEQETLSRYVGWGGLSQAFDNENSSWEKEYAHLVSLLTPEEYEMARASTLDAFYTSPTVVEAIYDTVERLGFKSGNILEPACGVGNFFGMLPDSMRNSKLYGVEKDSISGRIAKQLYPNAKISVEGYEKTTTPDSFFDLAIGNVPFGAYKVVDKKYDKHNFQIHDYFFAKTLDQVRPGGIIAFITSKGTMDKANSSIRKYIAQRAELLGAIRLPNTAFQKNAGTEVTSDILFLQRRDRLIDIEPDWIHLGLTEDGISVNSYFVEHPEMLLGTMVLDKRMNDKYGRTDYTTCMPDTDTDLAEQLKTAMLNIVGQITENELDDIEGIEDESIPADPNVRNFSYALLDGKVYYRENSQMNPVDVPKTTLERIKGMLALRDCAHTLIDYQLNDYSDYDIQAKQFELNRLYDNYTRRYGLINDRANSLAFSADSAYYLLCSLEILDENGDLERKADIFTKRTIKQKTVVTSVDTASEALAVSLGEKACVDLGYMSDLTGKDKKTLFNDLRGVVFLDFEAIGLTDSFVYRTADEFLSGNVREKLRKYQHFIEVLPKDDALYEAVSDNVHALEQAQPKDLDASEISVRLGSTWIDKKYIAQFMNELLQPPLYLKNVLQVNYSEHTGEWGITGSNRIPPSNVQACVTYGTQRMNAYEIIKETLNLKDVRIYDIKIVDGKEKRILNKKETTLAQQKQQQIKNAFKDWIFKDPVRRQELVQLYNEKFNSTRPREYDGSHINFSGMNPEIILKEHQINAIARILYGGNTLLAHEVGAGKTFEMVAAAMESKRLGLCQKSLFAVPNHLTEQWASEFLRLYPSANILVATAKEFETKNRKKFCAKIATGDYDAVIIGHSQLEKIPTSPERQERLLQEQLDEVMDGIEELKAAHAERFSIKQLERTKRSLEARLEKMADDSKKDSVVTFEQLGVDRLYVDESHNFKNLFLYTKMRNVAGLSTSEAQKSSDLFMKCRYMDELTGNKGVIFATGTPISNSMTELYTVQRYLQYDTLVKNDLTHFDAWASIFGETQTSIELAPEGNGYRARTRFSQFHNLPELMTIFREVADIKTADMLDLPRPQAHFETIAVKPSELQQDMVQDLSERARLVHAQLVDPTSDNMLKITSDGRKIGLDQRLINDMLPDEPGSKVNACMKNVYNIWRDTKDKRLTQLVFSDFSTPNADKRFNVYDDIKNKLLERGVPENEIAFIHGANTEIKKKELFAKVRKGQVRILFGSTAKLGAGTNVQNLLYASHDLDCPWRPADMEQRAGRIVRQGNTNPEVYIYRYVTESTFDAYLYQTIENKQKFISQIMTSKSPVRSCEDVDEQALSYAEIKALCAGNPLIKEKMDLDIDVARLRLLKADYQSQRYQLEDNLIKHFPESIERNKGFIVGFKRDIECLNAHTPSDPTVFAPMEVNGVTYNDKERAGDALLNACKKVKGSDALKVGTYKGFTMSLNFDSFAKLFKLTLKGSMSYTTELGPSNTGNITRINNALSDMSVRLKSCEAQLENVQKQMVDAEAELQKPFEFEEELALKSMRLVALDTELNIDKGGDDEPVFSDDDEPDTEEEQRSAKSVKPSLLAGIKAHTHNNVQSVRQNPNAEICM